MTLFVLLILGYSTQNEALFAGSVPEKVPTFQVTVRGSEPFYAGVRVNGRWVGDGSSEIPERQEVELVPDAPWPAQETYRVLRSKVDMKYETSAVRRDRLKKMLESQGYSVVETANGWLPVRGSDAEYAARLRKMAAAAIAATASVPEKAPGSAPAVPATGAPQRKYLVLLVALPLACLAGIVVVAQKMVFGGGSAGKA